jgi:hypothetical protein
LFRAGMGNDEERAIVGGANAFKGLRSSSNAGIVENLILRLQLNSLRCLVH